MIEGVVMQPLRQIIDERGRVMHMLQNNNPLFKGFGEVYFSEVLPGIIKAWKLHNQSTQLFAVPVGQIRLVLYDNRPNSPSKGNTQEIITGRDNYQLIQIPPNIWYGYTCIGDVPALVANVIDSPYDQNESKTLPPNEKSIPYNW